MNLVIVAAAMVLAGSCDGALLFGGMLNPGQSAKGPVFWGTAGAEGALAAACTCWVVPFWMALKSNLKPGPDPHSSSTSLKAQYKVINVQKCFCRKVMFEQSNVYLLLTQWMDIHLANYHVSGVNEIPYHVHDKHTLHLLNYLTNM